MLSELVVLVAIKEAVTRKQMLNKQTKCKEMNMILSELSQMTAAHDCRVSKGNQNISDKPQDICMCTNFMKAQGLSGYDLIPVLLHLK